MNEQGLAVTLEYCAQSKKKPTGQEQRGSRPAPRIFSTVLSGLTGTTRPVDGGRDPCLPALQDDIASFALIPGGGGCFEWAVDGEVISSKNATGRFPDVDEIMELIANRL